MSNTKAITIRMPLELLSVLRARGETSSYVINAVRERLERERLEEIAKGLACLADDSEANDISDFAPLQSKVMRRVD